MSRRVRVRVLAVLASLAVVATVAWVPADRASATVAAPGGYTALVPARVLDTRTGVGVTQGAVTAGGTVHLQVTGTGGVPTTGVSAVVLNVTVTGPTSGGYLTVYPDQGTRPLASNLNFTTGQTIPNLVVAPVAANGKVALYNGSSGTIHLVADVSGYYLAGTPNVEGAFGSLAPARVLDTRTGVGVTQGAVTAGGTVHLQVTGTGGVPTTGVSAVVLNVTVTGPTSGGYLTVYPDQGTRPLASNLNFTTGQTIPNLVVAPVAANGKVALYNGSSGTIHLVADVSGYYLAGTPNVEGAFGSLAPARVLDTRTGVGVTQGAVTAGGTVHLQVTGTGGVPTTGVSAVVLNVTVTGPTSGGYLTVYPDQGTRPLASNLNFTTGQTIPNLVVAPVAANGKVALYNGSSGTIHLVADVSGYVRSEPGPSPGSYAGQGFDACSAPSSALMAAWLGTSPYRAIGVYIGGDNRACSQPELTPSWVSTQQTAGWHLLPIYLGPQPYCTTSTKTDRFTDLDASPAGQAAADDAVNQARTLGLAAGSTIYYDMEAYATTDSVCRSAVLTFQGAWTQRLHDLGFLSGFYGSLASGIKDQVTVYNTTPFVRPDAIWFARYDGVATVSDASIPSTYWVHRRIKQYQSPAQTGGPETYGNQTLSVDRNQLDLGP